MPIVRVDLAVEPRSSVGAHTAAVREVVGRGVVVALLDVEASRRGQVILLEVAEVPLPEDGRGPARVVQILGEGHLVQRQPRRVRLVTATVLGAEAIREAPSHERGARRGTGGLHVVLGEQHPLVAQLLEMGHLKIAVVTCGVLAPGHVRVPQVVGDDQQEVGAHRERRRRRRRRRGRRQRRRRRGRRRRSRRGRRAPGRSRRAIRIRLRILGPLS